MKNSVFSTITTRLRYLLLSCAAGGTLILNQDYRQSQDHPSAQTRRHLPSISQIIENSDFTRLKEIFGFLPLGPIETGDRKFPKLYLTAEAYQNPNFNNNSTKQAHERQEKVQEEMMSIQLKYQREVDRLEKELQSLKKQLLVQKDRSSSAKKIRRIKKSLIDMYSDVLDELCVYDSNYNVQDQLPRVVVIGDQSAGKTSVLEMITKARIFPRGAGEMMTRSPVQVTLSEGPYHVAAFKDSTKEFDLTKEADLAALRREIELRMTVAVQKGQTISNEVISLTVKGPGLQRMVLVDLPGVISTETIGMASDTKNSIIRLANSYMSNPNAIILCIQDGSVDAERSNVTDLVSKMDPHGKRTIFVLTKVDLAEKNLHDRDRIKKILDGRLFPMKALGYFAVVTGKGFDPMTKDFVDFLKKTFDLGNAEDSIESIQKYEEEFFRQSKLFRDGIFKATQTTTRNLSFAVSDCFWKMVKESVEQQSDAFRAQRFNLETEWKNSFPRIREQDRDELFEKARSEILDEIVSLGQIPSRYWEEILSKELWTSMSNFIFNDIFLKASQAETLGAFNTMVDVKLQKWAEKELPKLCVEVGQKVLLEEFKNLIEREHRSRSYDPIASDLKFEVVQAAQSRHQWDTKALESLRVIQIQALQDRNVPDKQNWEVAIKFMENNLKRELENEKDRFKSDEDDASWMKYIGLGRTSPEEKKRQQTIKELEKVLMSRNQTDRTNFSLRSQLDLDEATAVKKNLQAQKIDVTNEYIQDIWRHSHKIHLVKRNVETCVDCRRFFYYYQKGFDDQGLDCREVVFFWRLRRMIEITSNAIRQQISNIETRRLEREVKEILDDFSADETLKKRVFTGKRVDIAEDLKRVRQIQEKLEEFIEALSLEK